MPSWLYPASLALLSLLVAALERLFPRRAQKLLRPRLGSDLVHLIFNGHFLGVILYGIATVHLIPHLDRQLTAWGIRDQVYLGAAKDLPLWLQIGIALFAVDFMQWCVHNLLHRVPWLWELHKCHHSVADGEMDWVVSFRFQWAEVVVYKSLLYLPMALLGFSPVAMMVHAIFGTLIGHLNHANLDLTWGPLRYLLNSPNMHLWHHDYEGDSKTTKNFGIIFSCWDWIFGTATMPDEPPARIGFKGEESYPENFFGASAWPLQKLFPSSMSARARRWTGAGIGLALLGLGWIFHSR